MQILIPSYGRANAPHLTHHYLPHRWWGRITYVVHPDQYQAYRDRLPPALKVTPLPYEPGNMGQLRRRAVRDLVEDKFLFLDDDLRFYVRRADKPDRLRYTDEIAAHEMLAEVEEKLEDFAHVGISHREGNNRYALPWVNNVRCTRAVAHHRATYLRHRPTLSLMEDFDVALQMLTDGHALCVLTYWAQGQRGTQAAGGCADFRNHESQARAARALAAKFTDFVRLRTKNTKGGLGESLDVTILWKKAYESSQQH